MKKTDREHLKEDPFQQFFVLAVESLKKYKKHIFMGLAAVVAIVLIVVLVHVYQNYTASVENRLYSEAVAIKTNPDLSVDQKIEKLTKLETKSGISASAKLFLATLYFEKGDLKKSQEALDGLSTSKIKLFNDQKKLLQANILISSNKRQEALDLLNQLVVDPNAEIGKDFLLLKMAQLQAKMEQNEAAITNLNKLLEEHYQSSYAAQARTLLNELQEN